VTQPVEAASKPAKAAEQELVDQIVAEIGPLIARRQRFMARTWCRQEVSMVHLHVLLLLDTEGPLSMGRLAENIDVSLPSATGIVTRMEERGLVRRLHGEDDRRLVMVQLSEAGRSALEGADYFRRQHITHAAHQPLARGPRPARGLRSRRSCGPRNAHRSAHVKDHQQSRTPYHKTNQSPEWRR
jgi:DNA-binding MarR family transcriptional regulator